MLKEEKMEKKKLMAKDEIKRFIKDVNTENFGTLELWFLLKLGSPK